MKKGVTLIEDFTILFDGALTVVIISVVVGTGIILYSTQKYSPAPCALNNK